MAVPLVAFACNRLSGHVGCRPSDVFHPRTSSRAPSSADSITSIARGLPEIDCRTTSVGSTWHAIRVSAQMLRAFALQILAHFSPKVALPCPPRDQSWLPFPEHSVVDRHYRGGRAAGDSRGASAKQALARVQDKRRMGQA